MTILKRIGLLFWYFLWGCRCRDAFAAQNPASGSLIYLRGTGNDENKKINDSVAYGGCIDRVQSEAE